MDSSQWVAPVAVSLATTVTNRVTNSEPVEALAVVRGALRWANSHVDARGASRRAPGSGHRVKL